LEGGASGSGRGLKLDERAGREASLAALRRHLAAAPPAYLEGAVRNPALGTGEMLLLLRNRGAPGRLLQSVGRDRRWTRSYRIRRALALHPRTSLALARDLVRHLFWKELVEVSVAPHVHPVARRLAETCLANQLESMALGERIALARRASRGLIGLLCRSDEEPVLRALLANPHLVEADAVLVASSAGAPPDLLAHLAEHPGWGRRRAVCLALDRNERTPIPAALRALSRLGARDLLDLCRAPDIPEIVRVGARRRLSHAGSLALPAAEAQREPG
jgi:hypothetical protein